MKYAIRRKGTDLYLNKDDKPVPFSQAYLYEFYETALEISESDEEVVPVQFVPLSTVICEEIEKLKAEIIRLKASRDEIRDQYHRLIQETTISAIARDIQKIEDARFIEEMENKLSK